MAAPRPPRCARALPTRRRRSGWETKTEAHPDRGRLARARRVRRQEGADAAGRPEPAPQADRRGHAVDADRADDAARPGPAAPVRRAAEAVGRTARRQIQPAAEVKMDHFELRNGELYAED